LGKVLSDRAHGDCCNPRNDNHCHYASYFATDRLMYPARMRKPMPARFRKKEPMVLAIIGGMVKAYAIRDVAAAVGGGVPARSRISSAAIACG
jgi:hypothetical protein